MGILEEHGRPAHQACYAPPIVLAWSIARFLRAKRGATFCNECIAATCTLSHDEVTKATTILRVSPDFLLLVGAQCAACAHVGIAIGALEPIAPAQ